MIDVTPKLAKLGVSKANIAKFTPYLNSMMDKAGINTEPRINAFLAQIAHESGNLNFTKENMNYTAEQLLKTWPSKFKTAAIAKTFEKQPQKIANHVYGGRMGNTSPGDGYKYIGRGIIGNTGKSQYAALKKATGIDFVSNPELLEQPKYAVMAAVKYWVDRKLNTYADKGDYDSIGKIINVGNNKSNVPVIGKADRDIKYKILSGLKGGVAAIKKNPYTSLVILAIIICIFAYTVTRVRD